MKKFWSTIGVMMIFLPMLIPSALFGQWWLFSVFMIFGACFGVVEIVANAKTGETVSQKFWKLKGVSKTKAIIIVVGMEVGWAFLMLHFMWHK